MRDRNKIKKMQSGFTLVELLIVVIILAILAAIVVPQFSSSTDDANEAALATNLANIRASIDLYYQQHGDYPSATAATASSCGGTAGTGAKDSDTAFLEQLSLYTDADGRACSTRTDSGTTDVYIYGPYLNKAELPMSITNYSDLTIVTAGNLIMTGATEGTADKGWKFDNISGKYIADDENYDNL